MRVVICLLALFSTSGWAASAANTVEQLSSQVAPLWQSIRPTCVMALDLELQQAVSSRIEFLDSQLIASNLTAHLSPLSLNKDKAWKHPSWSSREKLEKSALSEEERESFREYFFKLQTQKPNPERKKLVQQVQNMSESLNFVLRKELWKMCHALGFHSIPQKQLETAVHQRWLKQKTIVKVQLNKELAAFYFYSFRKLPNAELASIANASLPLSLWVETSKSSIEQYFQQLRGELLAIKFELVEPSSDDVSFPTRQPFNPAPFIE
ncbi:MAG: hypothetical protein ACJAYK_000724 [Crocinitomicaceae bacterium]|jgi:hypothetical protein